MHVSNGSHEEEEEFDFGEVLVHQVCTLLQTLYPAVLEHACQDRHLEQAAVIRQQLSMDTNDHLV